MNAADVLELVAQQVDAGCSLKSVWSRLHTESLNAVGGTTSNGGYPDLLGDVFAAVCLAAGCSQTYLGPVLRKQFWDAESMSVLLRDAAEGRLLMVPGMARTLRVVA